MHVLLSVLFVRVGTSRGTNNLHAKSLVNIPIYNNPVATYNAFQLTTSRHDERKLTIIRVFLKLDQVPGDKKGANPTVV